MSSRVIVATCVAVSLSGPLGAQQKGPAPSDEVKRQVAVFEGMLANSIKQAGEKIAKRAADIEPGVALLFESDPIVSGAFIPGIGPHFDVQIPEILHSSLRLWEMSVRSQNPQGPRPVQAQPLPMANGQPPRASSAVAADEVVPAFNPDVEYAERVRESFVEAILDGASAIDVPAGQSLTVVAKSIADTLFPQANALNLKTRGRQLILTIKGDDLIAFKQGKLTRDEARQKILDVRF